MNKDSSEINEIRTNFRTIDNSKKGFINFAQLTQYLYKTPYSMPDFMKKGQTHWFNHYDKISQNNFVVLMLGLKYGFQDFSQIGFDLSKQIQALKQNQGTKNLSNEKNNKSFIQLFINKNPNLEDDKQLNHLIQIKAGINKKKKLQKRQQLASILKHSPSQIFLSLKFKAQKNGDQIASQLEAILNILFQLSAQLGPTVLLVTQNIKFTCNYQEGFIYIVAELNHTFFDYLLEYLDQTMQAVSPYYNFEVVIKILSNFSKILHQNFDFLSNSINVKAQLDVDRLSFRKLKNVYYENVQKQQKDLSTAAMIMLTQEIQLSTSFTNLKECLESFGVSSQSIQKPGVYADKIKQISIKQLLGSFLPEYSQIFDLIEQSCQPEGQISLNLGNIYFQLDFKIQIQGLFKIF